MAHKKRQRPNRGKVVVSFNIGHVQIERMRAIAPALGLRMGAAITEAIQEWCADREPMAERINEYLYDQRQKRGR